MKKILLISMLALAACGNNQTTTNAKDEKMTTDSTASIVDAARQAYLFGYPLLVMDATRQVMTNVSKPFNKGRLLAPLNQLVSANTFPDDKFRDVVRPNCDTYYTQGWVDLSDGPMVLELPDTRGRYYLFPILDAWTDIFFSPGKRTTGTQAQTWLITAPGWNGSVPQGMKQVKSPTNMVWLIGRTQVNSAADGSTVVKKIQDGYKMMPLNQYGKQYSPPPGKIDSAVPLRSPNDAVTELSVADYFNRLNKLMSSNPPAASDSAEMNKLAALGIAPGANFDLSKFSPAVQDSLKTIPIWAKNEMLKHGLSKGEPVNGWSVSRGLGDYGTRYTSRAGTAYGGLGANLDADAMYPSSLVDEDGEPYDGSKHDYILHFDSGKTPPANAFWSLTMYDNQGFLCANPINRFAIGDRDKLKKNADGSVDIYIQHKSPDSNKKSNWLPAPDGPFNLLLRVYWPKEEMIKGDWQTPPVKKVKT